MLKDPNEIAEQAKIQFPILKKNLVYSPKRENKNNYLNRN
jgi:hypothetical protein